MSNAQREILRGYLADESAEIDQIHFLSGGQISQNSLTVVTIKDDERITETFASDGHCESIRIAQLVIK